MAFSQNFSVLAIILIYFVQKGALETDVPSTTTLEDLTTTDLEDLFRSYDAQYPQQNVGETGDADGEYQSDQKVQELAIEDGPKPEEESDIEEVVERRIKRIPDDKNLWDVGQLVEKASNQLILLNKLQEMKKKQLKAVEAFMGARDDAKSTETTVKEPKDPKEILKEQTLEVLRSKDAEKSKKSHESHETSRSNDRTLPLANFLNYFSPTSTTTYPPILKVKNKIVESTDDFYEDFPSDRRATRSVDVDSQFFSKFASYLMRSFGHVPDNHQENRPETLVKREIEDHIDVDAHNDLENEVFPTTQRQIPENEVIHPKNESPLVESIQTIPDPETRLEFTKDVHPRIEELEEVVQEPTGPVHLTVIEEDGTVIELTERPMELSPLLEKFSEVVTEEPPKEVNEGDTDKREVFSTTPEEPTEETTPGNFHYKSEKDNEVISQESVSEPEGYAKEERFAEVVVTEKAEEFTEAPTEQTTTQEEFVWSGDIREEGRQVLAEDKFEEAILLPTTLPPDSVSEDIVSQSYQEIQTLSEHFTTDFPTADISPGQEVLPTTELVLEDFVTEVTTPCSEFEEKKSKLKDVLEASGRSSSSSSSSEESSTSESVSIDSTTVKSEVPDTEKEDLSKGDLYDLLSQPVNDLKPSTQGSSESSEEMLQMGRKEAKSRSLDVNQAVIVSQTPEEISAIEEETKPASDNHSVKKKGGVSRELPQEDTEETTTEVTTESRSFDGETVEDALQTIVDTVDVVMDTKKSIEAFQDSVETTETSLTTNRPLVSTKNTRDVVGFGLDDSPIGHEESLPLDRTPTETSTVAVSMATTAVVAVILLLGIGIFAVMMRTRVQGGIDLAAV
ncbi:uncharacterized protein LOC129798018 isoform X2 [Phlebotomus papatasi]|uniref:uncharacterized protein LOC129798018 isoform X2 n=1 Tax=Phlebotomus papatasi TaxID=29031 RepID=UPI0024846B27|nr:uncharacterized protein LOC129798018 isoform X2 [Phlebotomus papatasi]